MVSDHRVKQYIWTDRGAVNGSNIGPYYTEHPLNGELYRIVIKNNSCAGSFFLFESGDTPLVLYKNQAIVSGTIPNVAQFYPVQYQIGPNNEAIYNGSCVTTAVLNGHFGFYVSGTISGTASKFGQVELYYKN